MQLSASMCKFSDYLYMRQVYRVQTLGSACLLQGIGKETKKSTVKGRWTNLMFSQRNNPYCDLLENSFFSWKFGLFEVSLVHKKRL